MNVHDFIQKVVPNDAGGVIFEAGIRHGEDTVAILDRVPNCRYVGFEPDPTNIRHVVDAGVDKRITFVPKALAAAAGTRTFYLSTADGVQGTSSSLNKPKVHLQRFPHVTFDKTVTVEATTIDAVMDQLGLDHIDFLWLDVQGGELAALKGAARHLPAIRHVYLEYYEVEMYEGQPRLDAILGLLGSGWTVIDRFPAEVLLKNEGYRKP